MKFDVDINVYYVALKVGSYFQLKCVTPVELVSDVVCNIDNCQFCNQANINIDNFKVIRTCNTEYNTKIQEAF